MPREKPNIDDCGARQRDTWCEAWRLLMMFDITPPESGFIYIARKRRFSLLLRLFLGRFFIVCWTGILSHTKLTSSDKYHHFRCFDIQACLHATDAFFGARDTAFRYHIRSLAETLGEADYIIIPAVCLIFRFKMLDAVLFAEADAEDRDSFSSWSHYCSLDDYAHRAASPAGSSYILRAAMPHFLAMATHACRTPEVI